MPSRLGPAAGLRQQREQGAGGRIPAAHAKALGERRRTRDRAASASCTGGGRGDSGRVPCALHGRQAEVQLDHAGAGAVGEEAELAGPSDRTAPPPACRRPVAMCMTPVSPEMSTSARRITAPVSWRPSGPGQAGDVGPGQLGDPAAPARIVVGPPSTRDVGAGRRDPPGELHPVLRRPALGGVRRARRHRHDRPVLSQPQAGEPLAPPLVGLLADEEVGRPAVGHRRRGPPRPRSSAPRPGGSPP